MQRSRYSLIILTILFSVGSLFAQNDSVSYNSQIQFHLVNSGYSLSYLSFLSNESAIRYKVDFAFSVSGKNTDGNTTSFNNGLYDYERKFSNKTDANYQSLSFAVDYISYPLVKSLFRMFIGGGPFLSLTRNYNKTTNDENSIQNSNQNQYSYYNENLSYSLGLGVEGIIGVECLITKQISILGEYGIAASYFWTKEKYSNGNSSQQSKSDYNSEGTGKGWNLNLRSLRIGIAFRF